MVNLPLGTLWPLQIWEEYAYMGRPLSEWDWFLRGEHPGGVGAECTRQEGQVQRNMRLRSLCLQVHCWLAPSLARPTTVSPLSLQTSARWEPTSSGAPRPPTLCRACSRPGGAAAATAASRWGAAHASVALAGWLAGRPRWRVRCFVVWQPSPQGEIACCRSLRSVTRSAFICLPGGDQGYLCGSGGDQGGRATHAVDGDQVKALLRWREGGPLA